MGIKGLSTFIKARYPSLIKNYPRRWDDPSIRGKKVALDGTLITVRMFKIPMDDEEIHSKRVIIGWHRLLTKMRESNVQPVVVYDEQGEREWKKVEAERRFVDRTKHIARSLHEDNRQKRYEGLRELITDINSLGMEDRKRLGAELNSVGLPRISGGNLDDGPSDLSLSPEEGPTSYSPLFHRVVDVTMEHIMATRPPPKLTGCKSQAAMFEEAEKNRQTADSPELGTDSIEGVQAPPISEYTETPRQSRLTANEAELLQSMMDSLSYPEDAPPDAEDLSIPLSQLEERSKTFALSHDRSYAIPSAEDHAEAKELIQAMGVPIVIARIPYEAEGLASSMARAGLVDFVGSEDSDVLGYEAPLLKGVTSSNKPLSIVDGTKLRGALELDQSTFLDFITLCGNDSIKNIPGVGPARAFKHLIKSKSIRGVFKDNPPLATLAGPTYLENVLVSRNMFRNLPPLPSLEELVPVPVGKEEINEFLEERHGLVAPEKLDVGYVEGLARGIEDESDYEDVEQQLMVKPYENLSTAGPPNDFDDLDGLDALADEISRSRD